MSSPITPESVFLNRRRFIRDALALGAVAAASTGAACAKTDGKKEANKTVAPDATPAADTETPYDTVATFNNYYEFGLSKADPARNAGTLRTVGWKVAVEGEVEKPRVFTLEELMAIAPLEDRVYRMRCVEAWSMVIPWRGYSLSKFIEKVHPTSDAKYVQFFSIADSSMMPGLNSGVLDFPYREALRMDEAMERLTLLTFGMYGKPLPNQNGAPVRVVVPWKYGFKNCKSIVKIRFTKERPQTSWTMANLAEYGFYANVNPDVPHPRWSQAHEIRLGERKRRDTLLFNGYDEVAPLYKGMDLKENY
jgi:sulfoxide reductase catalytic subunit YedY